MNKSVVLLGLGLALCGCATSSTVAQEGELAILAPAEDECVALLTDAQKSYIEMSADDRREEFADKHYREKEMGLPRERLEGERHDRKAYWPKAVRLAWTAKDGVGYRVVVRDAKDDKCVYETTVTGAVAHVDNLEIAANYRWTVSGDGKTAAAAFRTEGLAPRIIRYPGVPNVRDLGGRIGLGGRRVRQGLVFRSAGLNDNAHKGVIGKSRVEGENGEYIRTRFGIRSDIDLRSDTECAGMSGSPLGETVTWFHISSSAYGGMQKEGGKKSFAKVFRVFLERKNYPIDFHCIAGQDRTGAVAFILNALLGVAEDELALDWEVTGFWNRDTGFNHENRYDHLVNGFKKNYPAPTIRESVEQYVLSLGFTEADLETFRRIMLED